MSTYDRLKMVFSRTTQIINDVSEQQQDAEVLSTGSTKESLDDFSVYVEYIFLTTEERQKLSESEHEFLIEQIEFFDPIESVHNSLRSPGFIQSILHSKRSRRILELIQKDENWLKTKPTKDDERLILEILTQNTDILGPRHLKKLFNEQFVLEEPCLEAWVLAVNKALKIVYKEELM